MSCGTCGIQASDTMQGDTGVPAGAPTTARPRCPRCRAFVRESGAECQNPRCPTRRGGAAGGPGAGAGRTGQAIPVADPQLVTLVRAIAHVALDQNDFGRGTQRRNKARPVAAYLLAQEGTDPAAYGRQAEAAVDPLRGGQGIRSKQDRQQVRQETLAAIGAELAAEGRWLSRGARQPQAALRAWQGSVSLYRVANRPQEMAEALQRMEEVASDGNPPLVTAARTWVAAQLAEHQAALDQHCPLALFALRLSLGRLYELEEGHGSPTAKQHYDQASHLAVTREDLRADLQGRMSTAFNMLSIGEARLENPQWEQDAQTIAQEIIAGGGYPSTQPAHEFEGRSYPAHTYVGDIFYSNITGRVDHRVGKETRKYERRGAVFSRVCRLLQQANYWIHS